MVIVPYTFHKARFQAPLMRGYWVKLYCFFDGERIHHFFHESDCIENSLLARECGVPVESFTQSILVTKSDFTKIFNEIESYVHSSDSYSES